VCNLECNPAAWQARGARPLPQHAVANHSASGHFTALLLRLLSRMPILPCQTPRAPSCGTPTTHARSSASRNVFLNIMAFCRDMFQPVLMKKAYLNALLRCARSGQRQRCHAGHVYLLNAPASFTSSATRLQIAALHLPRRDV